MTGSATDSFINARIDRYEIRERIGTGGMARVFKAWDANLDRTIAIKILHEHLAEDSTFKERFEREAKLVASFNHPNIVQIYDFNVLAQGRKSISYMVMPFIPGKTLKDILEEHATNDKPLNYDRILEILLDLASALEYAHDRGMVHRDVKPGNILFDDQGRTILTDFGIARLIQSSRLTVDNSTIGTPTYMSPEQAAGEPVDDRSDLYALGVIMFEMLAGQPPFQDENTISTMLKHVNEPLPPVSDYLAHPNPYLDSVIFRAMAKNVEYRYQSAQEFALDAKMAFEEKALPSLSSISLPPKDFPVPTLVTALVTPPSSQVVVPKTMQVSSRNFPLTPVNIFAFGLTIIVILVIFNLLIQSAPLATAGAQPEARVETMTDNTFETVRDPRSSFESTFDGNDDYNG